MSIVWVDRFGDIWPHDDPMSPVGYLPGFCDPGDPRPAAEQIDERYVHGGWCPSSPKLKLEGWPEAPVLTYPGDPPLRWIATAKLRDEELVLFQGSFLAIIQSDGSYEIARVD